MARKDVSAALERGRLDVMSELASQVSMAVACQITGIPSRTPRA